MPASPIVVPGPAEAAIRKPNFLIVGAAKSGTTSLFQYLRGHPDVFMPDLKEASYFAGEGVKNEADYFALVTPDYRPVFRAFNRSRVVRSSLLRKILEEPSPWKNLLKALTPDNPRLKAKAWLRRFNYKERRLPSLPYAERERPWRLFAPDVAELETVLGRRLECWSAQSSNVSAAPGRRSVSFGAKIEQT